MNSQGWEFPAEGAWVPANIIFLSCSSEAFFLKMRIVLLLPLLHAFPYVVSFRKCYVSLSFIPREAQTKRRILNGVLSFPIYIKSLPNQNGGVNITSCFSTIDSSCPNKWFIVDAMLRARCTILSENRANFLWMPPF